jgi:Domain of unknown function (DUF4340)
LVVSAMSGPRSVINVVVATAALTYLVAMVLSGAQPVQRQLVAFEPKGVLKTPPERIRRVELSRGGDSITLVRTGEKTWATPEGAEISTEAGARISMTVQMMHASGPARVIRSEELAGADFAGFELDSPRIVAKLYEAGENPILTVRFGGHNPDGFLQYMRIEGNGDVYLISRFVGEGWTDALDRIVHP